MPPRPGLISLSILKDGWGMIHIAHADLMAGAPVRAEGAS